MKPRWPARLRGRIAMWWLWRRCDWVYRFAHHPLCDRFGRDVVRAGRLRVCRSCLLLYGAIVMAAAGAAWGRIGWQALVPGAIALALSWPPLYARLARPAKDWLRLLAGATIGLAISLIVRGQWLPGIIALAAIAGAYLAYLPSYRRVKSHACDGCPELARGGTCSGFRMQAERILAFEPRATEIVMAMTNVQMTNDESSPKPE